MHSLSSFQDLSDLRPATRASPFAMFFRPLGRDAFSMDLCGLCRLAGQLPGLRPSLCSFAPSGLMHSLSSFQDLSDLRPATRASPFAMFIRPFGPDAPARATTVTACDSSRGFFHGARAG